MRDGCPDAYVRRVMVRAMTDDLIDRLRALPPQPAHPPDRFASVARRVSPKVYYEVDFRYPDGRDLQPAVDPSSVPSIEHGSLQARDASTVVPILQRLLG